jgi:ribosomal-protein-alanine N-acetyltransferase
LNIGSSETHQLIETINLKLIPAEMKHFDAMRNFIRLGKLMDCQIAPGWDPFPGAMHTARAVLKKNPHFAGWWTYLFVHKEDNVLIGCGGFHGVPDTIGRVEIGYGISPAYTKRGFAKEAARALVEYAFAHSDVAFVDAHTVAWENASTSILKRVGFTFMVEKQDPDMGAVWLWQITREAFQEQQSKQLGVGLAQNEESGQR